MSLLAYLEGLDRSFINLKETYGYGLGFQQFGIHGSVSSIRSEIINIDPNLADLNLLDGTTVAFKLIGEFGIIALILLCCYISKTLSIYKWLKNITIHSASKNDPRDVFFACIFFTYFISFFIRGTGYFSSSGFLFLASLFWVYGRSNKFIDFR